MCVACFTLPPPPPPPTLFFEEGPGQESLLDFDTCFLRKTDLMQGHRGGDRSCVHSGAQRQRLTGMQARGQGRTKGVGELAASPRNINKEAMEPPAAADGCLFAEACGMHRKCQVCSLSHWRD